MATKKQEGQATNPARFSPKMGQKAQKPSKNRGYFRFLLGSLNSDGVRSDSDSSFSPTHLPLFDSSIDFLDLFDFVIDLMIDEFDQFLVDLKLVHFFLHFYPLISD